MLALRVCIVYSFILYMTCAYFLTILPLPSVDEVAEYTGPIMDLIPFHAWTKFWENTSLVISDPSTYLTAVQEQIFYEPFFNILLLFPLGVYLRYYFKRSWLQTLLIGFCVSLSFEVLQITGLLGIYPRPYRLFQVDDLINNTFGTVLGYWFTPLFSFFLPSREQLDAVAYSRGREVSLVRRGVAFCLDWGIIGGVLYVIDKVIAVPTLFDMIFLRGKRAVLLYCIIVFGYFMVFPWLTRGQTLGKLLVGIRVMTERSKRPSLVQYLIRYGLQYYVVLPAPFVVASVFTSGETGFSHFIGVILAILMGCVFLYFVCQLLLVFLSGQNRLFYEIWSRTTQVSTINHLGHRQETEGTRPRRTQNRR